MHYQTADHTEVDISMKNKTVFLLLSVTAVLMIFSSCEKRNGESLLEISIKRQCHANMNTLCTDQASYCDAEGNWAETIEELDEYFGRLWPLTCPENGEQYVIEITEDGYRIECPSGHGSINTGRRSWTESNDR